MIASLRRFFTCSLLALPLVACGDDKGETDANVTATDPTMSTSDPSSTTDEPTTTTGPTTTVDPTVTATTDDSTSTTAPNPSTTTQDPVTSTTDEPVTSTTDDSTSTTDDSTTTTGDALSWEADIFPMVVQGKCGCHGGGSGGLTMNDASDSYANLVDVDSSESPGFRRVAPGDSAGSYFLAKVNGMAGDAPFNGNGSQMPLGAPGLPADVIDMLAQWIDEGAAP